VSTSFVLFVIALGITAYAWETPADATTRMAILANAKPVEAVVEAEVEAIAENSSLLEPVDEGQAAGVLALEAAPPQFLSVSEPFAAAARELPAQFDLYEPTAELGQSTDLGTLDFATEIADNYEAVDPRRIFAEGFYRLYATFEYQGMEDGMVWAWIWRRDGELLEGGHQVWAYGDEGPGYIFFEPEEGFQSGEYSLEIWVNRELLNAGTVVMNSAAAAANN
jgi:hypothetical protein